MPLPTSIGDLSTTAALNYPAGTDSPATLDDVQRAHGAFIAKIRDAVPVSSGSNLTFTGTGNRITGDFSNVTIANRTMFQTSTVNGITSVSAIPNGSNTAANFSVYSNNGALDAARGQFAILSGEVRVSSDAVGAGGYYPLTFYTGGSERMRIDTSGNVTVATQTAGDNSTKVATTAYVKTATDASGVQIQPISASIAANAITVTPSALSLDFRNTTLTTGTVTRVSGTPAALVIAATDSFGLVTAAGNQRIAILAINNAGTIELAASALVGGVSLDETGVITTATAATLGTHIKAANVRTGVAYRVIGFVDATFTTATGWGSLALVQGTGGQALAAMSSLGYGQTWQNVTGSRTSGTTYYNTTGRPISLSMYNSSAGSVATAKITVNGIDVSFAQFSVGAALGAMSINAIVPPEASYVYTDGGIGCTKIELR